jgi:hypothetical protein
VRCQCSDSSSCVFGPSSSSRREERDFGVVNPASDERLAHVDDAVEEAHVLPAQREQLAPAHRRPERDEGERARQLPPGALVALRLFL